MDQLKIEQRARQVKLLFSDFIAYLHRQGFIIGVDHHLRLQALLNKMGTDCKPADLKLLLCPIFATSKKQQQQFYRAFDAYFLPLEPGIKEPVPTRRFSRKRDTVTGTDSGGSPEKKRKKRDKTEGPAAPPIWSFVLLTVILLWLVVWLSSPSGEQTQAEAIQPYSPSQASEFAHIVYEHARSRQERKNDKEDIIPSALQVSRENAFEKAQQWVRDIDRLNRDSVARPREEAPRFYERYGHTIRALGIYAPFILFFIFEAYRKSRRRLLLESQRGRKPPYIWPIKVETPEPALVKNARFYDAARVLRERLESEVQRLDIDKTINRTIEKAGYPDLRYRTVTRPPEYLILIDWPAYRDHFPYLFDSFSRALEDEGLFVRRYFYDKDPRVCFKEIDGERIYLSDLKTRTSDHRLIIFGSCDTLLDPVTGQLDRWASMFNAWKERTLLTTVQPKLWGAREIALARSFILLPATIDGLNAVKNHFSMRVRPDLKAWKQDDDLPLPPIEYEEYDYNEEHFDDSTIDDLETYLGHDVFQWLCACAVYPELHWDLTLFLGSLGCMPVSLISEENVLRLIRLPWFRTGKMPDELRWRLMKKLDPGINNAVRKAIINLLEKNPAPKGSVAHDTYRLHLVLQKWMMSGKTRKERKKLIRELKELSEQDIIRDYTQLNLRDTMPQSGLQFSLPRRMQKLFFRKGTHVLGMKSWLRLAIAIVISITCAIIFQPPSTAGTAAAVKTVYPFPEIAALPGGRFLMGSDPGEGTNTANQRERPRHEVTLDPFAIGKYEVTNAQFAEYVNTGNAMSRDHAERFTAYSSFIKIKENGKNGNGVVLEAEKGYENYPANGVSFEEAMGYCAWLEQKTGIPFRLPTEAEWEYACRAGSDTLYSFGDSEIEAHNYGWFGKGAGLEGPKEVGLKRPNGFDLYDMHGNLWEWCLDGVTPNYNNAREDGMAINPKENDKRRAIRGGSYGHSQANARSALREFAEMEPGAEVKFIGFRVVASLNEGYADSKKEDSVASASFDPQLWEVNTQNDGVFIVIGSYDFNADVQPAYKEVLRLRSKTGKNVQLYYAINYKFAAVIGPFPSQESAQEILSETRKMIPDAYIHIARDFTYRYKRLPASSPVQDQSVTGSDINDRKLAEAIINHAFRGILDRPPNSRDEKVYYMRNVVDKKVLTLCKELFDGSEFEKRLNSITPDDIALHIYEVILEREPNAQEMNEARRMIKERTFYEKVAELLLSPDFRERFEGPGRPAQERAEH